MIRLVLRRAATSIGLFVVMAVLTFIAIEALPGDACTSLLGRAATANKLNQCREANGLYQPVLERLMSWLGGILQGDLGYSIKRARPVSELIGARVRNSLVLAAVSGALAFPAAVLMGLAVGIATAHGKTSRWARVVDSIGLVLMTLPEFVTASALWLMFSIWIPILPAVSVLSSSSSLADVVAGIWLPAVTLAVVVFAHVMRSMRASVVATSSRPFVDAARLRGVAESAVLRRHLLPAALPPTINVISVTAAWLLTGTFVVEVVFNFPGLGRLAVDAISDRDTDLILALTLLGLAVFVVSSFVSDTATRVLDPRTRSATES